MTAERPPRPLPTALAGTLVFVSSGMVLVLEILGVRLLAPFVGSSLDTYTAIIGTVLAGISAGTYLGGKLADRLSPARMLGPVLLISGATSLLILPLVRLIGSTIETPSAVNVVSMSAVALLLPAAVLSAVSPIVVKLQLASLAETGSIVGRLSALGTAGAIGGTFVTGFVLLAYFRTSHIIIAIGVVLLLAGVVFSVLYGKAEGHRLSAACFAVALMGAPLTWSNGYFCDRESPYYCMRLVDDPNDATGRFLALDHLRHSYVDVAQPEHLQFWYVEAMAAVFDHEKPADEIDVLTIGGGGFTIPRYLAATRTAARTTSLEIDPALVDFNEQRLGLNGVTGLDVVIGDARSSMRRLPSGRYDLVVADAFGNESVPWHLSTVEFAREIRRTMAADGLLVMNVIDYGSRDLLRAEMKTLSEVWPHVAVVERRRGASVVDGNFVVVASGRPIGTDALEARLAELSQASFLVEGAEAVRFFGDAEVLTDDFAPADQLLARNLRR